MMILLASNWVSGVEFGFPRP